MDCPTPNSWRSTGVRLQISFHGNNRLTHIFSIFISFADPRVDSFPLMSSPLPTLLICVSYYLIVKKIGPYLMRDRAPYKLNNLLIAYNLFQVLFSAYLFYEWGMSGWFGKYSYRCQPVDYSMSDEAVRMLSVSWWYYFSKFTEFFDTVSALLMKKLFPWQLHGRSF